MTTIVLSHFTWFRSLCYLQMVFLVKASLNRYFDDENGMPGSCGELTVGRTVPFLASLAATQFPGVQTTNFSHTVESLFKISSHFIATLRETSDHEAASFAWNTQLWSGSLLLCRNTRRYWCRPPLLRVMQSLVFGRGL